MTALFANLDDIAVVAGPTTGKPDIVLSAIVRNEMFFLPAFLAHYRALGVERFVMLDDRSDDGTFDYLAGQPDVVVVQSSWKYGDRIEPAMLGGAALTTPRILYVWRTLLLQRFAGAKGTVHVDADEFVQLPNGMRFQDLANALEREGREAIWGIMLDLYPKSFSSFEAMRGAEGIDREAEWYFDGLRHLKLRKSKHPKVLYAGSRARLFQSHGLLGDENRLRNLLKSRFGLRVPRYNAIRKPVFLRWREGAYFASSHATQLPASTRMLLPIEHYRFTGALYKRIDTALRENSYSGGSNDYRRMIRLFERMRENDGSFCSPKSRRAGMDAYIETGNAILPDTASG